MSKRKKKKLKKPIIKIPVPKACYSGRPGDPHNNLDNYRPGGAFDPEALGLYDLGGR